MLAWPGRRCLRRRGPRGRRRPRVREKARARGRGDSALPPGRTRCSRRIPHGPARRRVGAARAEAREDIGSLAAARSAPVRTLPRAARANREANRRSRDATESCGWRGARARRPRRLHALRRATCRRRRGAAPLRAEAASSSVATRLADRRSPAPTTARVGTRVERPRLGRWRCRPAGPRMMPCEPLKLEILDRKRCAENTLLSPEGARGRGSMDSHVKETRGARAAIAEEVQQIASVLMELLERSACLPTHARTPVRVACEGVSRRLGETRLTLALV